MLPPATPLPEFLLPYDTLAEQYHVDHRQKTVKSYSSGQYTIYLGLEFCYKSTRHNKFKVSI